MKQFIIKYIDSNPGIKIKMEKFGIKSGSFADVVRGKATPSPAKLYMICHVIAVYTNIPIYDIIIDMIYMIEDEVNNGANTSRKL